MEEKVNEAVKLTEDYVQNKINNLNEKEKRIFNGMFNKEIRSTGMSVFFAFLGLHYLYINASSLKNWVLQAMYTGTGAGCGIWLLADVIRIKKIIGKNYTQKAEKILNKI